MEERNEEIHLEGWKRATISTDELVHPTLLKSKLITNVDVVNMEKFREDLKKSLK